MGKGRSNCGGAGDTGGRNGMEANGVRKNQSNGVVKAGKTKAKKSKKNTNTKLNKLHGKGRARAELDSKVLVRGWSDDYQTRQLNRLKQPEESFMESFRDSKTNGVKPKKNKGAMAGNGKIEPKKSKAGQKSKKLKTGSKKEKEKKKKKKKKKNSIFQLKLPPDEGAESQPLSSVPWMQGHARVDQNTAVNGICRSPKTMPRSEKKMSLPTDIFDSRAMDALDLEIKAFANYVQLTDVECTAREKWISCMESIAKDTFCQTNQQNNSYGRRKKSQLKSKKVPHSQTQHFQERSIELQVFGSFATLPVCTFKSDVDIALWGAVKPDQMPPNQSGAQETNKKRMDNGKQGPSKAQATLDKKRRQEEKKQRWRNALALHTSASNKTSSDEPATEQLPSDGENENPDALFVVDRVGELKPPRQGSVTDSDDFLGGFDDSGDKSAQEKLEGESSNDEDSADKLEGMKKRETLAVRWHGVLNQVSSNSQESSQENESDNTHDNDSNGKGDDDSDSDVEIDGNMEDLNMDKDNVEVSFVSSAGAGGQSAQTRLSQRKRQEVVGALNRFQRKLEKLMPCKGQVIRNARVPIIKLATEAGFEVDIAVGGHSGSDTSLFAAKQAAMYESFSPVVLVLKVLLEQQGLDTPFSGGLGSFKLYNLVAFHLYKHVVKLGGADRPSEVLLSFFFRFGISGGREEDHLRTKLTQGLVPIESPSTGTVDLGAVCLLGGCLELFATCWKRLRKQLVAEKGGNCPSLSSSYLSILVDATRLKYDRKERLLKARSLCTKQSDYGERRCSTTSTEKREVIQFAKSIGCSQEESRQARDLSADELIAGYCN